MKVFVAGATGAIGSRLVPQLAATGHDVVAMTRSPAKADALRALSADPDAFMTRAVRRRRFPIGALEPRSVPRVVARLLGGEAAAIMMTEARGASNAKARRELGWQPRWPTWRLGFAKGLDG